MHRTVSAGVCGTGCPRRRQASAMREGMSPGRQQVRVVGVDQPAQGRHVGRLAQQPVERYGDAVVLPRAQRLLQEPEAHDVAQVADGAVDAQLVGEVGAPAVLGQHRVVQLEPDERPGAAGDVGEALRPGGHPDDGRRGVVRADGPTPAPASPRRRGAPRPAACPPACPAPAPAGAARGRCRGGRQISADQSARADVEQPGGGGVGDLADALAGQPEAHQVGDQQQPVPRPGAAPSRGRGELVDGVERQQLQAGSLVQDVGAQVERPPCPSPRRCGGRGSGPGCRAAAPDRSSSP